MEQLNLLIVEDNLIIGHDLSMRLQKAGYQVTDVIGSGPEAIEHLREHEVDLVLLDITLESEMDGIQVAEILNEEFQIPFIFLTANLDEATFERAKKTNPYAFITKPFKSIDLVNAIELASQRLLEESSGEPQLLNKRKVPYLLDDRIFVRHKERMVKIYVEEIHYVEADRSYCKVFTADKEYLLSAPLSQIEQKIKSEHFMRVHRSFLVNLRMVDSFDEQFLYFNDIRIPVSRSNRKDVLERFRKI